MTKRTLQKKRKVLKRKVLKRKGRPSAFTTNKELIIFADLYNKGLSTIDLMNIYKIKRSAIYKYINLIKNKNMIAI